MGKTPLWIQTLPLLRASTEAIWNVRHPIAAWLIARIGFTILAAWGATSQIMSSVIPAGGFLTPRLDGWAELLIDVWQRWDGQWYVKIMTEGYRPERIWTGGGDLLINPTPAFFPLYPAVSRAVAAILPVSFSVAGILVSTVSCLIALIFIFKIVQLDHAEPVAKNTIRYLLIFPTAFFLFAVYTEALFLCLTAASCYFALRHRWWIATGIGFFATLVRPTGILVLLPIGIEYVLWLRATGRRPRWELIAPAIVPLGLVGYALYLGQAVGDPLAFSAAQHNPIFGRQYQFPLQTLVDIVRSVDLSPSGLLGAQRIDEPIRIELYLGGLHESDGYNLLFFVAAVVLSVQAFRLVRPSLAVYAAAMIFFTILVPRPEVPLQSFPRFMLPIFPLFIVLGIWARSRRVDRLLSYPSLLLLGIFTVRFATWYWVA